MKNVQIILYSIALLIFTLRTVWAQSNTVKADTTKNNNLILPTDYKCSASNAIPQYTKSGEGIQSLIVIPGLGFDNSIFDDFVKSNQKHFTIYCITIPGYGKTYAPPLPPVGTSFGEQSWNKSTLEGIKKLFAKERLTKAIIVGHFVQGTQLALRMAIDYPELVGGVIILGGPAKFILINNGKPVEYPLASNINYIDRITAPNWFGPISKTDYDNGNYLPEVYSLNPAIANSLWKQSASVPLPVSVHALCEFLASDVTLEIEKIKCPVLVLRPTFTEDILQRPINNYLVPQFIDAWDKTALKNPLITIKDVKNAATCSWKDNPDEVNKAIKQFSQNLKSK